MAEEVNCWRCDRVGVSGQECAGCGATVGDATASRPASTDPKQRELDKIAEKYRSSRSSGKSSSSAGAIEVSELDLLREIAVNTASTTRGIGFIARAAYTIIVTTFLAYFAYDLAMKPVQTCEYSGCEPVWGIVVIAGVVSLVGLITTTGYLLAASRQPVSR